MARTFKATPKSWRANLIVISLAVLLCPFTTPVNAECISVTCYCGVQVPCGSSNEDCMRACGDSPSPGIDSGSGGSWQPLEPAGPSPEELERWRKSTEANDKGVECANKEDYDCAIYYYEEGLRLNPNNATARENLRKSRAKKANLLGIKYYQQGNWDEALQYFNDARKHYNYDFIAKNIHETKERKKQEMEVKAAQLREQASLEVADMLDALSSQMASAGKQQKEMTWINEMPFTLSPPDRGGELGRLSGPLEKGSSGRDPGSARPPAGTRMDGEGGAKGQAQAVEATGKQGVGARDDSEASFQAGRVFDRGDVQVSGDASVVDVRGVKPQEMPEEVRQKVRQDPRWQALDRKEQTYRAKQEKVQQKIEVIEKKLQAGEGNKGILQEELVQARDEQDKIDSQINVIKVEKGEVEKEVFHLSIEEKPAGGPADQGKQEKGE